MGNLLLMHKEKSVKNLFDDFVDSSREMKFESIVGLFTYVHLSLHWHLFSHQQNLFHRISIIRFVFFGNDESEYSWNGVELHVMRVGFLVVPLLFGVLLEQDEVVHVRPKVELTR